MKTIKFGSLNLVVENLSAIKPTGTCSIPEGADEMPAARWRTLSHDWIVSKSAFPAFQKKLRLGMKLPSELKSWVRKEYPEFDPDRLELVGMRDCGSFGAGGLRTRAEYAVPTQGTK